MTPSAQIDERFLLEVFSAILLEHDIEHWLASKDIDGAAVVALADQVEKLVVAAGESDHIFAGFMAGFQVGVDAERTRNQGSAVDHLRWALRWIRGCDEEPLSDEEADEYERWLAALKFAGLEEEEPS
jgi:hypothetical protein